VIGKDGQTWAAADLKHEACHWAAIGTALGRLRTTNGALAANVAFDVRISPLQVGVGQDVEPVLARVVAREAAKEAEAA